jgi:hypothetical protein
MSHDYVSNRPVCPSFSLSQPRGPYQCRFIPALSVPETSETSNCAAQHHHSNTRSSRRWRAGSSRRGISGRLREVAFHCLTKL